MIASARCAACGTELGSGRLACPRCGALVHAATLRQTAADAEARERDGELRAAVAAWRTALDLLPPEAGQAITIAQRIDRLGRRIEAGEGRAVSASPGSTGPGSASGALGSSPAEARFESAYPLPPATSPSTYGRSRSWLGGGLIAAGLLIWKLKAVLVFALTKAKFLLLGLSKGGTFFSMLLSLGVYWVAFGWAFALGLVLAIYVHEMGHVWALQRLGIRASWPMFLPGIGAVVRLRQRLASPREDARVGLAGPIWGLGAALATLLVFLAGGGPYWAALTRVGAWLNLFNLLPVWQLDGGRATNAMARGQRLLVTAAMVTMFVVTREGLLLLLAVAALIRAFGPGARAAGDGDWRATIEMAGLVVVLSLLADLAVPGLDVNRAGS